MESRAGKLSFSKGRLFSDPSEKVGGTEEPPWK